MVRPLVAGLDGEATALEAGCGVGEWIELVMSLPETPPTMDIRGFDLSPELIELARTRLAGTVPDEHLYVADLLDPGAWAPDGAPPPGCDLILAFDVIQQLPPSDQPAGTAALFRALRPGGHLVVFDQDARSPAGRKMGLRKAVTRWLHIPLVPRWYLIARYPSAKRLVTFLEALGGSVQLVRRGSGARFAVVARRSG
jgi:SAM-dependent methyltransferase